MASTLWSKYNHYLWYGISFFRGLNFSVPIWSFFLADFLWFSFAQAATLGVISMITSMIFEVPSGTRADIYGKKKILLIGLGISILSASTYLWAEMYSVFVISELVRWLWMAMISGCLTPLMYDRYVSNNIKEEFNVYSRNAHMAIMLGRVIATGVAGYMFLVDPYLPYIGILISLVLRFVLASVLDEVRVKSIDTAIPSTLTYIKKWYTDFMSADSGRLRYISFFFLWWFVFANLIWLVYQPLFTDMWLSISALWVLYAIASLLTLIGSRLTKYLYDGKNYPKRIVATFLWLLSLAWLLLLVLPGLRKVSVLIILQITFGWFGPIMDVYINKNVWSEQRSTVNSMVELLDSSTILIWWVLAGYLFDYFGLGAVYLSLAIWGWVLLVLFVVFGPNKTIV